jgi:hypothetical protein
MLALEGTSQAGDLATVMCSGWAKRALLMLV